MSMTKQKLEQLIDQYEVKVRRCAERRVLYSDPVIGWTEQEKIDVLTALKMLLEKWDER